MDMQSGLLALGVGAFTFATFLAVVRLTWALFAEQPEGFRRFVFLTMGCFVLSAILNASVRAFDLGWVLAAVTTALVVPILLLIAYAVPLGAAVAFRRGMSVRASRASNRRGS
ncbi:MAG: hypothetical protein WD557_10545 [Dehalococcoidia bacterium]